MPRALPWLTKAAVKKEAPRKAKSEQPPRKRSSSPGDLVNSDLESIGDSPKRKPKKRINREPSSSPPPVKVAPLVEYMREGFTMDDRYMMVEDEFTSTAKLFSLPLHQDEYERTKRRAKARGAETLKLIGHGTDGTTGQSRALKLSLEAEERAKRRRDAAGVGDEGSDGEEEDEFMADPQLAGLMTASQDTPRKSLRGFASDSQRTPRLAGGRTRDAVGGERVYKKPVISAIEEDHETEDEDDLDAYAARARSAARQRPTANTSAKHASEAVEEIPAKAEPSKKVGIFKQSANAGQTERERKDGDDTKSDVSTRTSMQPNSVKPAVVRKSSATRTVVRETNATTTQPKPIKMSRTAAILARRRETQPQTRPETASPVKQIKEEMKSQVRVTEEPVSQNQNRTRIMREQSPSPVRQALASKSLAHGRVERAKKEAEEKWKNQFDDIPTFL